MKKQYKLSVVNRCGGISRTLSTGCVVDFKAPVFNIVTQANIKGLRDAFLSESVPLDLFDPVGLGLQPVSTFHRPLSSSSDTRQHAVCSFQIDVCT